MKFLKIFIFIGLLLGMTLSLIAKEIQLPQCDSKSTCVNDKNFYVEVKRVVRRGDVMIVQLEYTGKSWRQYHFKFFERPFIGNATILDAEGNEFTINGKEISNFFLSEKEKKTLSLKFRGDKQKKITEPFDLTIKTRDDEITLFDLKQM